MVLNYIPSSPIGLKAIRLFLKETVPDVFADELEALSLLKEPLLKLEGKSLKQANADLEAR